MNEEEQKLFDNYTKELKINSEVANTLARDKNLSLFYKEALSIHNSPTNLANIIANEVARELKQSQDIKFTPKQIANLIEMVDDETISNKIAKQVFEDMAKSGKSASEIVEEKGLIQISDPAKILPIIEEVIKNNQDNVEKFKAGNKKLLGFFVGQVLKATGGKANPKVVNELVVKSIE